MSSRGDLSYSLEHDEYVLEHLRAQIVAHLGEQAVAFGGAWFPLAEAERIAAANRFTNIVFQNISSRRLVLDEPVDVILHEQIGEALVDEGVIEKTLDLKKRLATKSGRIVPTRFPGIDFGSVKDSLENENFKRSGQDWQVGARAAINYFLGDSSPILAFDLNNINDPDEVPKRVSASRVVRRSGRLDGFCLYFRVIFDADVDFDTSPFSPRSVWDNLHVRVESREYQQGDTVAYRLDIKDRFGFETWTVQINESGA